MAFLVLCPYCRYPKRLDVLPNLDSSWTICAYNAEGCMYVGDHPNQHECPSCGKKFAIQIIQRASYAHQ